MITKDDLLLLLTELQDTGINVNNEIMKTATSSSIPLDVLKFINTKRQLDVAAFYELLRKNYNNKKSPLYKNIVRDDVFSKPTELLTTLAALNLQILLFAKKLEDDKMFLKHSRAEEITRVLNNYYKTYDLLPCVKLVKLIRADLMVFEYVGGRRVLA